MKHGPLRGFKYTTNLECKIFNFIRQQYLDLAQAYHMNFIQPPLVAKTSIFQSLGTASDVVRKELYAFTQKDGEEVCLIPEYTRVFVEQMLHQNTYKGTYACFGPCFRYERPQLGRYRSFHQISIEFIGSYHYMKDVEVICFIRDFLRALQICNYTLWINSIGTAKDRKEYEQELKSYFAPHMDKMSKNAQAKYERGAFLRMLDSKDEEDLKYIEKAPKILDFISDTSKETYNKIKDTLVKLNIKFKENPLLVRGLDYYNDLVFEYTHEDLGAQSSMLGGGRYDGLFKEVSGREVAAIGFAAGVERLVHILEQNKEFVESFKEENKVALLPVEEGEYLYALEIFHLLKHKISIVILYEKSISHRLQQCNKENYKNVIIVGETEYKEKSLIIKNMQEGTQKTVRLDNIHDYL